jgi:hypothetical protein
MLNLPDKNARRDIIHGVKHVQEMAEGWLCARRTLGILNQLAMKWKVDLPEEAITVLEKYGRYSGDSNSPPLRGQNPRMSPSDFAQIWQPPDRGSSGYRLTAQADGVPRSTTVTSQPGCGTNVPNQAAQYATTGVPGFDSRIQFNSSTSTSSPSGMYDGVEQLVQDSQDWMMRDQAQLANGFENWTGLDFDMSLWPGHASGGQANSNSMGMPTSTGMTMPANSMYAANKEGAFAYDGSWDWMNYDNLSSFS